MKRFWKEAAVAREAGGFAILLDGRPVRTPGRNPLLVPGERLASEIAEEWKASGETVDPRAMPLTGLANAAIDHVSADPEAFASGLAAYGESDLACYRAEGPRELRERQERSWDGLLGWARRRYDVDFRTTRGVIHVTQPEATTQRLAHAVLALDAFQMAGLSPLVTIGGSLVIALAVLEGAVSPDEAWDAVTIDERWQLEQWGSDSDAEASLEARRQEFLVAARFLELLGD